MPNRSIVVSREQAGRSVLELLQTGFRLSRHHALRLLQEHQVQLEGKVCTQPQRQARAGQRVQVELPSEEKARARTGSKSKPTTPPIARAIRIVHTDREVIVVDKPAGLTTVRHAEETADFGMRAKKFLPPTLVDLLPGVLTAQGMKSGGRLRAVHRLDKETSGLVVLARTPAAESSLGRQFRAHTVGRRYLALVRGRAQQARIESNLVRDRGDGRRGSSGTGAGQRAVTHIHVVEPLGDFTLVECRLETGRTHQVRIHLGEAGTPLCGDHVYDRPLRGRPLADGSGATRPLLHATSLEFDHPSKGERLAFVADLPRDMQDRLERWRKRARTT